MKHFLKETDFKPHELGEVFALAREFKAKRGRHVPPVLAGQTWAMIFSKSSTRTRVSFEVGIHELGGNPLFLVHLVADWVQRGLLRSTPQGWDLADDAVPTLARHTRLLSAGGGPLSSSGPSPR